MVARLPFKAEKVDPPVELSGVSSILGDILEIETDRAQFRWRLGETVLCWDEDARVFWWPDPLCEVSMTDTQAKSEAYRRWHRRDPKLSRIISTPSRGQWYVLGDAKRIDYWSDRRRKKGVEYTHAIEGESRFYRYGGGKKWLYVLTGLEMTSRGIMG